MDLLVLLFSGLFFSGCVCFFGVHFVVYLFLWILPVGMTIGDSEEVERLISDSHRERALVVVNTIRCGTSQSSF